MAEAGASRRLSVLDLQHASRSRHLGLVQSVQLSATGDVFTLEAFLAGSFLQAFPGILLQLVLIPAILLALDKAGLVRFRREEKE